jgi:RNA polymerase sigma factor (sigma-70 family)
MAPQSARTMRTTLARKADDVVSRIYRSLPFGYRMARVLLKISMDTREILGRVALAEMIKSGVIEIPDIKGRPAYDYIGAVKKRGADALPRGSGRALGDKVWAIAKKKYPKGLLVEDAFSQVMLKMMERPFFHEGWTYKSAEAFLIRSVLNKLADMVRHIKRSPVDVREIDLERAGPKDFSHLERMLDRIQLRDLMRKLDRVDPRALEWFQFQLEGRTNRELAELWGVSEQRVHQVVEKFLPKVRAIITDVVEEAEEDAV